MRTLEEIANAPCSGDVIVLRSGHVTYEVLEASLSMQPLLRLSDAVLARRTSVRNDVYEGVGQVLLSKAAWRDLVLFGACAAVQVSNSATVENVESLQ